MGGFETQLRVEALGGGAGNVGAELHLAAAARAALGEGPFDHFCADAAAAMGGGDADAFDLAAQHALVGEAGEIGELQGADDVAVLFRDGEEMGGVGVYGVEGGGVGGVVGGFPGLAEMVVGEHGDDGGDVFEAGLAECYGHDCVLVPRSADKRFLVLFFKKEPLAF